MHELTELIRNDMLPALGVTEPGALAFCAAKARACLGGLERSLARLRDAGKIEYRGSKRTGGWFVRT